MHDLFSNMERLSQNMSFDYKDIRNRFAKDKIPIIAGKTAEQVWCKVLKGLLPPLYQVIPNGRIISKSDCTSPEIDILVVKGEHPPQLLEQNIFLASGVAAAFEVKLTLESKHIQESFDRCKKVKSLCSSRFGTPYKELQSPIIYGLLALSHSWKKPSSRPDELIAKKFKFYESVYDLGWHPRDFIDIVSVADLNTWSIRKIIYHHSIKRKITWPDGSKEDGSIAFSPKAAPDISMLHNPFIDISYRDISYERKAEEKPTYSMIGFHANFMNLLAWEDKSVREIAKYYRSALSDPPGSRSFPPGRKGFSIDWDYTTTLSEHVRNAFSTGNFEYGMQIVDESGGTALDDYEEWTGVK